MKIGFIGTNFISDSVADAIKESGLFELSAVLSRTEDHGEAFKRKHGFKKAYTSQDDFFLSDIDAVYIAVPNSLHFSYAAKALKYGKHVLCEKPFCSNAKESAELIKEAQKRQLVILEAMRPAFDCAISAIEKGINQIGAIRGAFFEYCQYSSRYDAFKKGNIMRAFDQQYSNAAVMDIGVYPIYLCLRLFGRPKKILSSSVKLKNGFEGSGTALLSYNEFNAVISYSKIHQLSQSSYVAGENGSVIFDNVSRTGNVMLLKDGKKTNIDFEYRKNNISYEIQEFAHLIKTGQYMHKHSKYTLLEMQTLDEIRKQNNIIFPADGAADIN